MCLNNTSLLPGTCLREWPSDSLALSTSQVSSSQSLCTCQRPTVGKGAPRTRWCWKASSESVAWSSSTPLRSQISWIVFYSSHCHQNRHLGYPRCHLKVYWRHSNLHDRIKRINRTSMTTSTCRTITDMVFMPCGMINMSCIIRLSCQKDGWLY